ncbi:glycosyltransferase family 2 protein [Aquimarina sp. W85]|uniref:glycosyltransferase family 2 protein n=1 Tax=Aquimarina rhodophyticola TaxID=3342246 RepID=UPI003672F2A4
MNKFSLITIYQNQKKDLKNLLDAIEHGNEHPDEVIIVCMKCDLDILNEYSFDIRCISYNYKHTGGVPISEARNLGVKSASFENLIFLNINCIPDSNFVGSMIRHALLYEGLIMGTPKYVNQKMDGDISLERLAAASVFHPQRPEVYDIKQEFNYQLFWSLCFTISKTQYTILNGFDTRFSGYGAEDLDFAFKARELNCPFYINDAIVYHQQYAFYSLPLNNFEYVIKNSDLFYEKWGEWPMDSTLEKFTQLELIEWKNDQKKPITIRKKPSVHLIQEHTLKGQTHI